MKPIVLFMALLFSAAAAQSSKFIESGLGQGNAYTIAGQSGSEPDYGWKDRVAFIVGGGTALIATELYDIPVVDKTTNFVTLEKANTIKSNLSLGIAYTPYIKNVVRTVKFIDANTNTVQEKTIVGYEPRGITFSLFLNPLNLTGVSANSIANTVDVGFGLGWRSGDFIFLFTNEYFLARQPRKYFVDIYRNNDTAYEINGHPQTTIDTTDNNIFKNKVAVSWGIKIAYTFNITKKFIF